MSFSNKVVIVTGSSSGIGAASAVKFAEAGAHVVINGRNEAKLAKVSERCRSVGRAPLVVKGDVSKDEDAKKLIDETIKKFGKIDILINNAGIMRLGTVLSGKLLSTYDEVINTNVRAVVHLTALAAPHIISTKGNIINISSAGAHKVIYGMSAYCLSKAALSHFTKAVALELAAEGVRVNTISPGPVDTDIQENSGVSMEEMQASASQSNLNFPLNRRSASEEVADLALYLASDKAVGVTGSDFVLDNGMLLV